MKLSSAMYVCKRCVWELKYVQIEVCHLYCSWEAHNHTTQSEHGKVCAGCLQTHAISVHLVKPKETIVVLLSEVVTVCVLERLLPEHVVTPHMVGSRCTNCLQ